MSFAGHAYNLPSHTHTINQKSIYDDYGFRIDPLKEEELEEGEVLCDVCKGYGYITDEAWGRRVCKKCQGMAKLDWIEKIVGKKEPDYSGYSGCTSYSSGWSGSSGGPSGYWGLGQAVSGVSGYVVGTSGFVSGYYSSPPSHSHTPLQPPTGTIVYDTFDNQLKVHDGNSFKTIGVESEKTIGNKLVNGLKKLIWGE
jgi:hypothetical protein